MNDTMVVTGDSTFCPVIPSINTNSNFHILDSGSGAGIVKIWDLSALLGATALGELIAPLRRVNMKGILHYPIKDIFQSTYTDLVIIAKYEGKKKKDKVKVVEVKWN